MKPAQTQRASISVHEIWRKVVRVSARAVHTATESHPTQPSAHTESSPSLSPPSWSSSFKSTSCVFDSPFFCFWYSVASLLCRCWCWWCRSCYLFRIEFVLPVVVWSGPSVPRAIRHCRAISFINRRAIIVLACCLGSRRLDSSAITTKIKKGVWVCMRERRWL